MSIGAGIAIASVWSCVGLAMFAEQVTGAGMVVVLIAAVLATGAIANHTGGQ